MYYYKYRGSSPIAVPNQWLHASYGGYDCKRLRRTDIAPLLWDLVGEEVLKEHESLAKGVITTESPFWIGKIISPKLSQIHLGDAVHPSLEYEMRPITRTTAWKNRTAGRRKQWENEKARGDIVFRPYSVGNVTVTRYPGFHLSDLHETPKAWQYYPGESWTRAEVNWPCSKQPIYPVEGGGVHRSAAFSSRYEALYTQYLVPETSRALDPYRVTPSLEAAVDAFILNLQKPKPIPGLVTTVQCEASKGAWDALTSVMETVRETLPMMLRMVIQALELYQLARGKISERMKRLPGPIPPPPRRKDKYQLVYRKSLQKETLREDVASIWLWYRYAVQPIAMDLLNIQAYLDREFKEYRSYRRGREHTLTFEHEGWTGSVQAVDRCLVRHEYDFSYFDGLQINPWKTGWEALPTRIITDWFVNVGDIMATQKAPSNLKQTKMSYSTRVNNVLVLTHPDHSGRVEIQIDSYTRGHNTNLSYIDLEFRNNMTWKRFIDAIAIFWGGKKDVLRYR